LNVTQKLGKKRVKLKPVIVKAIARELCAFMWATANKTEISATT
jgi:hypothetical protein